MAKLLVLYYSRDGSVRALASEVARGVESVADAQAVVRTVPPVSADGAAPQPPETDAYVLPADLAECDGLLLGSPTRFGGLATPLKHFFDQCVAEWLTGALANKPAGVFCATGSPHGGQESTLLGMLLPLMHHGMVVVGLPYPGTPLANTDGGGSPYGAGHVSGSEGDSILTADERKLARLIGRRVALCAGPLKVGFAGESG